MSDLKQDTILYTKDGRKMGNAIVTRKVGENKYEIRTDYNNFALLNEVEIKDLFHVGEVCDETHKNYSKNIEKIIPDYEDLVFRAGKVVSLADTMIEAFGNTEEDECWKMAIVAALTDAYRGSPINKNPNPK